MPESSTKIVSSNLYIRSNTATTVLQLFLLKVFMIRLSLRQGIGFDIEYNEEICYVAIEDDERELMLGFNGVIIKIPFVQIEIGDMFEMELNKK